MNFSQIFTSSIGKKIVMGVTGIFLISFLMVHAGINACMFANDGGDLFNRAAHFMGSNWVIRTMEIVLFAGLLAHIFQGIALTLDHKTHRPVKYAVNPGNETSKWYSRSMGLLGTLLLMFLIIHLYHFWAPSRLGGSMGVHALGEKWVSSGEMVHDLYAEMQEEFSHLWVVIVYVLAMGSLAYHLLHGFQSAFRTLGLSHKKYTPTIEKAGIAFSILVPALFAAMPVYIFLFHKN